VKIEHFKMLYAWFGGRNVTQDFHQEKFCWLISQNFCANFPQRYILCQIVSSRYNKHLLEAVGAKIGRKLKYLDELKNIALILIAKWVAIDAECTGFRSGPRTNPNPQ